MKGLKVSLIAFVLMASMLILAVHQVYFWYDEYLRQLYPWKYDLGYAIDEQKRQLAYNNWLLWNGILVFLSLTLIVSSAIIWASVKKERQENE